MTLRFSSLILIRVARSSLQPISRPILPSTPTPYKLATTRKMSDASKTKSEEEWRAILTPEQVCLSRCPSHSPGTPPYRERAHSSGCFVRRAPRVPARGSTRSIKQTGSTPVRVATPRFTRATPSSTAAAAGRHFSMVIIVPFATCGLAVLTVCVPSFASHPWRCDAPRRPHPRDGTHRDHLYCLRRSSRPCVQRGGFQNPK